MLSTNLMYPLDLCIFFPTALAKTQDCHGAPTRHALCSEPIILSQDELDQRYAGSGCTPYK